MDIEKRKIAILLSEGSAFEKKEGLHHLLEHIFFDEIKEVFKGITSEDYICLLFKKAEPSELLRNLNNIKIKKVDIDGIRNKLIYEIKNENKEINIFWAKVWENTRYKNNPIGNISDINNISMREINNLYNKILKKPIYIYDHNRNRVSIINKYKHKYKINKIIKIRDIKKIEYCNKVHNIVRFQNKNEEVFLYSRILKSINPNKNIQIIEKKLESLLIYEDNIIFPEDNDINKLKKTEITNIYNSYKNLNNIFEERALNELKTIYYYGIFWRNKIRKIMNISYNNIKNINYLIKKVSLTEIKK